MYDGRIIIIAEPDEQPFYSLLKDGGGCVEIVPLALGLAAIDSHNPALCLLDCGGFPDRGLALLAEIKWTRTDLPVLFLTDVSSEEIVIRAFKNGARDYFRKPVDIFELRNAVQDLLQLRLKTREVRTSFKMPHETGSRSTIRPQSIDLPEKITRVIHYIEQNLSRPISLDDAANLACLSKFHFCRYFRRHTDMSLVQYVAHARIKAAQSMLKQKTAIISSVAFRVGYNSQCEFNRQFKKITGHTPTGYREQFLANASFPLLRTIAISHQKRAIIAKQTIPDRI